MDLDEIVKGVKRVHVSNVVKCFQAKHKATCFECDTFRWVCKRGFCFKCTLCKNDVVPKSKRINVV
jgi:hypothetical protein